MSDPFGRGVSYLFVGGPRDGETLHTFRHIGHLLIPDTEGGTHWYFGRSETKQVGDNTFLYRDFLDYLGKSFTNEPPEVR